MHVSLGWLYRYLRTHDIVELVSTYDGLTGYKGLGHNKGIVTFDSVVVCTPGGGVPSGAQSHPSPSDWLQFTVTELTSHCNRTGPDHGVENGKIR